MTDNFTPLPTLVENIEKPQNLPAKQEEAGKGRINNNPTGKGGFGDHPELINRTGQNRRSLTTEVYRVLLEKAKGKNGQELDYDMFHALARSIVAKAFDGKDKDMKKEIWHQIDGMPTQKNEITGKDGEALKVIVEDFK